MSAMFTMRDLLTGLPYMHAYQSLHQNHDLHLTRVSLLVTLINRCIKNKLAMVVFLNTFFILINLFKVQKASAVIGISDAIPGLT
jgi:hypothetical protein